MVPSDRSAGVGTTFGVTTGGLAVLDAVGADSANEGEGPPPRPVLPEALERGRSVDAPDLGGPEPVPPFGREGARGLR